jgi:hypothetical protein
MNAVDAFVKEKVLPEFQDTAAFLRALMRESAPQATEQMSYALPMWKVNGLVAWISPNKQGISFGFTFGAGFDDRYGLLKGKAKNARHVQIRKVADAKANEDALRDYIRQALEHDSKH